MRQLWLDAKLVGTKRREKSFTITGTIISVRLRGIPVPSTERSTRMRKQNVDFLTSSQKYFEANCSSSDIQTRVRAALSSALGSDMAAN
jgi:hypothetical protein